MRVLNTRLAMSAIPASLSNSVASFSIRASIKRSLGMLAMISLVNLKSL